MYFKRIIEINDELEDLIPGADDEVIESLRKELLELEFQQDEFADGHSAGMDYHIGSGVDASLLDIPRSAAWRRGFAQAALDS